MLKPIALLLSLSSPVLAPARDKTENWIQVRSEHFIVATNSNEKQGRRLAHQLERVRAMFHIAFPKMQIDPGTPIIVLAIKDEKDFRTLEPELHLAKGQLKLGGLFLRAPDKNYVLMRLDAEGKHPYSAVYHEYSGNGWREALPGLVSITGESRRLMGGRRSIRSSASWTCAVSRKIIFITTRRGGVRSRCYTCFLIGTGRDARAKRFRCGCIRISNGWSCF